MTKSKHHKSHDEHHDEDVEHALPDAEPSAEIPPGCSEPNTVPPSVVGTSHDKNRKEKE